MSSPRIILLAHGSSDKRWCETFEKLAAPTLASVDNARVAYMELAEPSIDTIIMDGVAEGITEFTIVPLFLAAGRRGQLKHRNCTLRSRASGSKI